MFECVLLEIDDIPDQVFKKRFNPVGIPQENSRCFVDRWYSGTEGLRTRFKQCQMVGI